VGRAATAHAHSRTAGQRDLVGGSGTNAMGTFRLYGAAGQKTLRPQSQRSISAPRHGPRTNRRAMPPRWSGAVTQFRPGTSSRHTAPTVLVPGGVGHRHHSGGRHAWCWQRGDAGPSNLTKVVNGWAAGTDHAHPQRRAATATLWAVPAPMRDIQAIRWRPDRTLPIHSTAVKSRHGHGQRGTPPAMPTKR